MAYASPYRTYDYQLQPSPWTRVGQMLVGWGSDLNARRAAAAQRRDQLAYQNARAIAEDQYRQGQATADQAYRDRMTGLREAELRDRGVALPEPTTTVAGAAPPGGVGDTVAPAAPGVTVLSPAQQRDIAEKERLQKIADQSGARERNRRATAVQAAVAGAPSGTYIGEPGSIAGAVVEGVPLSSFRTPASATGPTGNTLYTMRARMAMNYLDALDAIDANVLYAKDPALKAQAVKAASERWGPSSPDEARAIIMNEQSRSGGGIPEPLPAGVGLFHGAPTTMPEYNAMTPEKPTTNSGVKPAALPPPDTTAPGVSASVKQTTSSKQVISADQADYLRTVKGWSDDQINARYIVR